MVMPSATVVLASASEVRRRLLEDAGVSIRVVPAHVDEAALRDGLIAEAAPHFAISETLAELKAQQVARRTPGEIVIGADQILVCEDAVFEKPEDAAGVGEHLRRLRGRPHRLLSAVCAVRDGDVLWHHNDAATLHMRDLSDAFIDAYVAAVGERARSSVGAYQLESVGSQLFSRIEGDYFTILGLPLLPLLDFLRNNGILIR